MNKAPLAERLRPQHLKDFVGQQHLIGEGKVINKILNSTLAPSMIFWGPPGVGKTTLAQIISRKLNLSFFTLSAINSGVKEVREVIDMAKKAGKAVLFIDEIHRFNKSQQDSLLAAVEKGIIILIGATTENPSFEVISPLLSRCQVYVLKSLAEMDLKALIEKALSKDEFLRQKNVVVREYDVLFRLSGGDARKLLNLLELVVDNTEGNEIEITNDAVLQFAQKKVTIYDKQGEQHYDIISAFIKSMRGSDPNGAVYWLARMIEGGEDPKFIARRMLILASEDIGNANPTALVIANNCFQAVTVIGYPECDLILSHTAIYLAASPKSNASYTAIRKAQQIIKKTGDLPVPLHLRNAPTKLMEELGYSKEYKYSQDYEGNFIHQEYLPEKLSNITFYEPGNNPRENDLRKNLKNLWQQHYKY